MKVSLIFLIAYLTAAIFAGGLRGAMERVWLWYAFRLERSAVLKNANYKRTIAPGLTMDAKFDQFIQYINGINWLPVTGVDNDRPYPNILQTAKTVYAYRKYNGPGKPSSRLYTDFPPNQFEKVVAGTKAYIAMLNGIGDAMKEAKQVVGSESKDYKFAVDAAKDVLHHRRADHYRVMNEWLEKAGFDTSSKELVFWTLKYSDGNYNFLDMVDTRAMYPVKDGLPVSNKIMQDRLDEFETDWRNSLSTNSHLTPINQVAGILERLEEKCYQTPLKRLA